VQSQSLDSTGFSRTFCRCITKSGRCSSGCKHFHHSLKANFVQTYKPPIGIDVQQLLQNSQGSNRMEALEAVPVGVVQERRAHAAGVREAHVYYKGMLCWRQGVLVNSGASGPWEHPDRLSMYVLCTSRGFKRSACKHLSRICVCVPIMTAFSKLVAN
jgi:hypothetical protein